MSLTALEICTIGTSVLLAAASTVPALSAPLERIDDFVGGWQSDSRAQLKKRLLAALPAPAVAEIMDAVDDAAVTSDALKSFVSDVLALSTIPAQVALLALSLAGRLAGPIQVLIVLVSIAAGIIVQGKYWLHGKLFGLRRATVCGLIAGVLALVAATIT